MATEYVEQRGAGYFIKGSRVSLDSIVLTFLRGESPEGIAESFPALTLEQIFGALAYYLANRETVDRYLQESERNFRSLRQDFRRKNPVLYARLEDARRTSYPSSR
jgi:uncharacterized protein (DUF433 family)